MKRSDYRRYDSWTGSIPNTVYRSAYRKNREVEEPNFNNRVTRFMMTGLGRYGLALAMGVLAAMAYALVFGLSFGQYLFFTVLFTAITVGISAFSRD